MTDFDAREFLEAFLAEAAEHIALAARRLLEVESALGQGEHRRQAVRDAYRALHTIKGLAGMVGVDPIVDLAHAMESVLRSSDASGGRLDRERLELLLTGVRSIEERLDAIARDRPVPPAPRELVDALLSSEIAPLEGAAVGLEIDLGNELASKLQLADREMLDEARRRGKNGYRLDFIPSAEKHAAGVNITSIRERVAEVAEIVRVIPLSRPESADAPAGLAFALILVSDAAPEAIAHAISSSAAEVRPMWSASEIAPHEPVEVREEVPGPASAAFVRVEVTRLDDALEKLSAVVVGRFRLLRAIQALREQGLDVSLIEEIASAGGRHLRELRAAIMRARMVPVAELLDRVPLIVRSLARSTGKAIRLEMDVGRAEVDKAVAERIFPAVVHLVRNAIDHGIEPAEERTRAGKQESGLLQIRCRERGNARLELVVEDDGRGIDRTAIADRAGRPVPQNDSALLDLIRLPGLSTAARASHTSGRGMGLDIVDRIVSMQLGGTLAVSSVEGRGTTFTINIPLSIAIVDAFTLICAGRTFAVPVGTIEEIVEVDPAKTVSAPGSRLVERRGQAIPLIDLALLLALDEQRDRRKALVVRRNEQTYAFAVDRMIGRQEVVIRPLEDPLVRVPGISGATDLGDGRPTLVLDLMALSAREVSA